MQKFQSMILALWSTHKKSGHDIRFEQIETKIPVIDINSVIKCVQKYSHDINFEQKHTTHPVTDINFVKNCMQNFQSLTLTLWSTAYKNSSHDTNFEQMHTKIPATDSNSVINCIQNSSHGIRFEQKHNITTIPVADNNFVWTSAYKNSNQDTNFEQLCTKIPATDMKFGHVTIWFWEFWPVQF